MTCSIETFACRLKPTHPFHLSKEKKYLPLSICPSWWHYCPKY